MAAAVASGRSAFGFVYYVDFHVKPASTQLQEFNINLNKAAHQA